MTRPSIVPVLGKSVLDAMAVRPPASSVVFLYQRLLPYHRARFLAVSRAFAEMGRTCVAVQVSAYDRSYGAIDCLTESDALDTSILTLFPEQEYLELQPRAVAAAVEAALVTLGPDTVFTPAPAFAEGAGALHYKARHACRLILMDDAWHQTDRRGWLTRRVKRLLYGFFDGAFLPAPLHGEYFAGLNIPRERQRYPVDVVDDIASIAPPPNASDLILEPYLLFVGRCVRIKQLDVLLHALASPELQALRLVVIGDGPEASAWRKLTNTLGLLNRVHWLGALSNEFVRTWMKNAQALLLPSKSETWGLVVNEAWSVGVPVIGSSSVGALRASYPVEWDWMMPPPGDVPAWRSALRHLLEQSTAERTEMAERLALLAQRYSLAAHADAALELAALPLRQRPPGWVSRLALAWPGRVAVY